MLMEDMDSADLLIPQYKEAENSEDDAAEESLSLRDLPLDHKQESENHHLESFRKNSRRSSSEPLDLFEFFSNGLIRSEICPAEDLIFCGRLIPLNDQSEKNFNKEEIRNQITFRKRSESLSGLQSSVSRSNSAKLNLKRSSRSLDYRKLHRHENSLSSPAPEIDRNYSKSAAKSDTPAKKASKPRWYLLMFGIVKFPAEMDLSDIKSRQIRRNSSPSPFFPANSRSSGEATWKLLRALSCKNHSSVDITAPLTA